MTKADTKIEELYQIINENDVIEKFNVHKNQKEELPDETIIEDLYIDKTTSSDYIYKINTKTAFIRNNTFDFSNSEAKAGAFNFEYSSNITIIDCKFINFKKTPIYYKDENSYTSNFLLFDNCSFVGCSYGIELHCYSLETITINNCSFENTNDPIHIKIYDKLKSLLYIINNKFIDCIRSIRILGLLNSYINDPIKVENNYFERIERPIQIEVKGSVLINDCYFKKNRYFAIYDVVSEAIIERCIFTESFFSRYIITVASQQCIFHNNTINSTEGGILFLNFGNYTITNNKFISINNTAINLSYSSSSKDDVIIINNNYMQNISNYILYIDRRKNVELSHNVITECQAKYSFYLKLLFYNEFTSTNITFLNCIYEVSCINIFLYNFKLELNNYTFENNIFHNGGVFGYDTAERNNELLIDNCIFIENQADENGGALCIKSFNIITILNCTFISNEVSNKGGAIYIDSFNSVEKCTIIGCNFKMNKDSSNNSHAIYCTDIINQLNIEDCNFTDNCQSETNLAEGYSISSNSREFTIQYSQIQFNDFKQSTTGIRVYKNTQIFEINKCEINKITGKPSFIIYSPIIIIYDLNIDSPETTTTAIEIEYNEETTINQLQINAQVDLAIDFLLPKLNNPYKISISNSTFYKYLLKFTKLIDISFSEFNIQNCRSTLNSEDSSIVYISNINSLYIRNSVISSCLSHEIFFIDSSYQYLHFDNINISSNQINNDQQSYLFIIKEYDDFSNTLFENVISDMPIISTPESEQQINLNNVTFRNCVSTSSLIQSLNSNIDISNSRFILNNAPIIDKLSGNLNIYNTAFNKCLGGFEIKSNVNDACIEKCNFLDCYDNISPFVITTSNPQFTFINNVIQFASNENGKSIGGLYIKSHGNIEIANNQFINIRKITKSGITIEESEISSIESDATVIFKYNKIQNAADANFGVLTINKQERFEINHNIIRDCKIHAGYSINIYLQDGNVFDNDLTIVNLTFNNCAANSVTGGGIGLLLEFGTTKTGILRLRDCTFKNNIIENITSDTSSNIGSGCGGAFETGNLSTTKIEFICIKCKFEGNQAANCGGALSIQSTLEATIMNCTFNNNKASQGGGAIYIFPKKYESDIDQLPSCTITGCEFSSNEDSSYNGNAIFFKYANDYNTTLVIKDCRFNNNFVSNNGSAISVEAPTFKIENTNVIDSMIKVDRNTELLIIEKCYIMGDIENRQLCILSSQLTIINDLAISQRRRNPIEINYNGPISINNMRFSSYFYGESAIDFLSFSQGQQIQINISNSYNEYSNLIQISDESVRSIQGFNIISCKCRSLILFSPSYMQTTTISNCHFINNDVNSIFFYNPKELFAPTDHLLFEDCTFESCQGDCIMINTYSSEMISICNCSFQKCHCAINHFSNYINVNMINNEFYECSNDYTICFLSNNIQNSNSITIEKNIFHNLRNAIHFKQESGFVSINNCQFENLSSYSICIYDSIKASINKCNFSIFKGGIKIKDKSRAANIDLHPELVLNECIFKSLQFEGNGGSLYIYSRFIISISKCQFIENEADENGGAIYVQEMISGEINIENCTFDHNVAKINSAIYIKEVSNSDIDISKCFFINNDENKNIIYSNGYNLIVHDILFVFENKNCNVRPILLGKSSKAEIYNVEFTKCSMNDEGGPAIKSEDEIEFINVHDCKFEDCKDTGSSILCSTSKVLFYNNIFICKETPTSSGLNIQNVEHVEIINCSFTRISSRKTGPFISPLNIISSSININEEIILIGLTFTNCYGRNPTCFSITVHNPFVLENITVKDNSLEQFESYLGVIDLNDYMGDEIFRFKHCKWINNNMFTQYGNGAGLRIINKPKMRYEFDNCIFENNRHYKNGGGFQEGGSADNVNKILTFKECLFKNNEAGENGGGISIETVLPFTIEGCIFEDNHAEMGGAIYINPTYTNIQAEFGSITNCIFKNNEATLDEGNILCIENSRTTQIIFDGSNEFTNNGESGSAIYSQCSDLKLIDITFVEDKLKTIHLIEGSGTTLTNCRFTGYSILANQKTKKVVFEYCVFTDCVDSYSLYVIESYSSVIEFTSSVINFTDPQISCGGIKINQYNTFISYNSTFKNIYSKYSNGAGIYFDAYKSINKRDNEVSITECTFDNLVSLNGVAIYISGEIPQKVTIVKSIFTNLKTTVSDVNSCNAIYIDNNTSNFDIKECEFKDCGNNGCVVLLNSQNTIIENTTITFTNIETCQGISIKKESHFEMINSTISNCFSSQFGGALSYQLYNKKPSLKYDKEKEFILIDNCQFKLNKALYNGGAISIQSYGKILIVNTSFESNIANYNQQSRIEILSTEKGKGGSISFQQINEAIESSIQIENCEFKNNEAHDGSSIYLSAENPDTNINIKNNKFIRKSNSNSSVILTDICSFSYFEIISENVYKIEDENVDEEDTNIFSSGCNYSITSTFTTINKYPNEYSTDHFTPSNEFTSSNSFAKIKEEETKRVNKITISKSFSLSYTYQKSVSFSLSYVFSNTYEMIFDYSKGTYTMVMTKTNYQAYFPYIIYYLSPMYIERNVTIEILFKKTISPEQLIGVVCGTTSVFFLILGVIILALRRRNEIKCQFDDFDDISSSDLEIYGKANDTQKIHISDNDDDDNDDDGSNNFSNELNENLI